MPFFFQFFCKFNRKTLFFIGKFYFSAKKCGVFNYFHQIAKKNCKNTFLARILLIKMRVKTLI